MSTTQREGRLQVTRMGVPVSLVTKTRVSSSSHGSHWAESDESPHEIRMIPDPGGESVDDDIFGLTAESDIVFITRDDVAEVTDGEFRDGSGEDASEITHRGTVFRVDHISPYHVSGQDIIACSEYDP